MRARCSLPHSTNKPSIAIVTKYSYCNRPRSAALNVLNESVKCPNQNSRQKSETGSRQSVIPQAQAGYTGPGDLPNGSGEAIAADSSTSSPLNSSELESPESTNPLQKVIKVYNNALARNPVGTKACTSFIGFSIGDRLAQTIMDAPFDPYRTLRLGLYGLLLDGPIGHAWYRLLDKYVEPNNPTGTKAVLTKTALDQLLWAPAMTCIFFAFLKLLEGHPDAILGTIQTKLVPTVVANYLLWPLAHYFNFKYVPSEHRILFNNVVSIAWNAWLSWFSHFGGGGPPDVVSSFLHGGPPDVVAGFSLPCGVKAESLAPHLMSAFKETSAMETLLQHWGVEALPSSHVGADLLSHYFDVKREMLDKCCTLPNIGL